MELFVVEASFLGFEVSSTASFKIILQHNFQKNMSGVVSQSMSLRFVKKSPVPVFKFKKSFVTGLSLIKNKTNELISPLFVVYNI